MNQTNHRHYLSKYFIEECLGKFKSHNRQWWDTQRQNREGETCCLLLDLLDVVEIERKIVYLAGLQVMAWWLYDRKYFDPDRTVYFDIKDLREYQVIDFIWQLQEAIGDKAYILLYAYYHALAMGEDGPLEKIKKEAQNGLFFGSSKSKLTHSEPEEKVTHFKNIIGRYLAAK